MEGVRLAMKDADLAAKPFDRPIAGTTCKDLKTTGTHGPWMPSGGGRGERCRACGLLRFTSPVEGEPPTFESFSPAPPLEPISGVRLTAVKPG